MVLNDVSKVLWAGVLFGSFWAALMEPVLTFPPLSPGWPGYDINDDAKMYMQAMVFMIWISGSGLSLWETTGIRIEGVLDIMYVVSN